MSQCPVLGITRDFWFCAYLFLCNFNLILYWDPLARAVELPWLPHSLPTGLQWWMEGSSLLRKKHSSSFISACFCWLVPAENPSLTGLACRGEVLQVEEHPGCHSVLDPRSTSQTLLEKTSNTAHLPRSSSLNLPPKGCATSLCLAACCQHPGVDARSF